MTAAHVQFQLVDVFADMPYTGNQLPVFFCSQELDYEQMLSITREFRQFESVFVRRDSSTGRWRVRVFDLKEELPFAGHPLIGAACAIAREEGNTCLAPMRLITASGEVPVTYDTRAASGDLCAWIAAPDVVFSAVSQAIAEKLISRYGLGADALDGCHEPMVVSAGLRYLVIPIQSAALGLCLPVSDIGELVRSVGAEYAVLLSVQDMEIRHWTNDGQLEDIATGSAAIAVTAYLARKTATADMVDFQIRQGRFLSRPSLISTRAVPDAHKGFSILLGGTTQFVASGVLHVLPCAGPLN